MKKADSPSSEERVDHLLRTAANLFLSKGFSATSVGEIAAQAKASKSTFYSRYPTKTKLFTEVFRRQADAAFHEFSTILLTGAEPREMLCAMGERLMRCVLDSNCIDLIRVVYMESRQIPELGQIYYDLGPNRGNRQLQEYFDKLVTDGFFQRDMNTKLAAEQFYDLLTGELVRRRALAIQPDFTPDEQRYRLDATVDMFLRAYCA